MRIEIGNPNPHQVLNGQATRLDVNDPCVTYVNIDDEYTCTPGADVPAMLQHLALNPVITRLPDQEMFVNMFNTQTGIWAHHGTGQALWVHCESSVYPEKAAEFARQLSIAFGCAIGRPDDIEDTHHTIYGPPGVGPGATGVVDHVAPAPTDEEIIARSGPGSERAPGLDYSELDTRPQPPQFISPPEEEA